MRLNTLSPAPGRIKSGKRVGRGIGSGLGKTAGRGHKGQKARAGGSVKPGFEGGQMPLQRRLPKYGFESRIGRVTAEVRLSDVAKLDAELVDLKVLRQEGLINANVQRVKIFLAGRIQRAVTIKGLAITKGARTAIEAAGGRVEP